MVENKNAKTGSHSYIRGRLNKTSSTGQKKIDRPRVSRQKKIISKKNPSRLLIIIIIVALLSWVPFSSYSCKTQKGKKDCQDINIYATIVNSELPLLTRFIPFINEEALAEKIMSIGQIESAVVYRTWYNTLKINLLERSIFATWNSTDKPSALFAVDRFGVIISEVGSFSAEEVNSALNIQDEVALIPTPGDGLVESSVVRDGLILMNQDLVNGYDFLHLLIDDSSREYQAVYKGKKDTKSILNILFTTIRPLERQLVDANLTLDYLTEQGSLVKFIDVRLASGTAYR